MHNLRLAVFCLGATSMLGACPPAEVAPDANADAIGLDAFRVDAALPSTPVVCGASTCAPGEICLQSMSSGSPTDVAPPDAGVFGGCVARPEACGSQGDCVSDCSSACVDAVCAVIPGYSTASLMVSGGGTQYACVVRRDAT